MRRCHYPAPPPLQHLFAKGAKVHVKESYLRMPGTQQLGGTGEGANSNQPVAIDAATNSEVPSNTTDAVNEAKEHARAGAGSTSGYSYEGFLESDKTHVRACSGISRQTLELLRAGDFATAVSVGNFKVCPRMQFRCLRMSLWFLGEDSGINATLLHACTC